VARLLEKYNKVVVPALKKEFNYKNIMQVPKIEKVVVNITTKELVQNPKLIDIIQSELAAITGQKPVVTIAKKSIATFKIREGLKLGAAVTLRNTKMYEFLDRFFNLALPRVRDFKGLSPKSFDGRGNYNVGLKEQLVFPEIVFDKIQGVRGMSITIVTSAKTDKEAKALLEQMGLPFRKSSKEELKVG
jgi:large subunit ribosomal protein L5